MGELAPASRTAVPSGMRAVPGGVFTMGADDFYPEEAPRRRVRVDPFLIDEAPVTNAAFATFVEATGYTTFAELPPDPRDYPDMPPEMAHAGSSVFEPTPGPVPLDDPILWWRHVFGADWRHPLGPDSSIDGLDDHPVVHVAYADAEAYAKWAGKALPTEAEWEFAARGGLDGAAYAWGDELAPAGATMANYWQGDFPVANRRSGGWQRTSPVGAFPANGYGLHDMIGNVWEWTSDWFALPRLERKAKGSCCIPANPRGGLKHQSHEPGAVVPIPRKVLKGGSHLCAPSYCRRYRPAARYPQTIDTTTGHIGFRCVVRRRSS